VENRVVDIVGVNVDLPVTSLEAARPFYDAVIGRPSDLNPPAMAEWILRRDPEVALRLVETDSPNPGSGRVGIGVPDVEAERTRLSTLLHSVPDVRRKAVVIAKLELTRPRRQPTHVMAGPAPSLTPDMTAPLGFPAKLSPTRASRGCRGT
jgi:hypothetical protein